MTARILIFCLVFCLGVGSRAAGQTPCAAVTGAQILGGDLARVVPAFKAVPPGVALAPSPLHGAVRTFPVSELQALASRFGVNATFPADVCFRFAQNLLIAPVLSGDDGSLEDLRSSNRDRRHE